MRRIYKKWNSVYTEYTYNKWTLVYREYTKMDFSIHRIYKKWTLVYRDYTKNVMKYVQVQNKHPTRVQVVRNSF